MSDHSMLIIHVGIRTAELAAAIVSSAEYGAKYFVRHDVAVGHCDGILPYSAFSVANILTQCPFLDKEPKCNTSQE